MNDPSTVALLQRWALALELTGAKQHTLEEQIKKDKADTHKAHHHLEANRKLEKKVAKKEKTLERERREVQEMMEEVTKRAEALYSAEQAHQVRVRVLGNISGCLCVLKFTKVDPKFAVFEHVNVRCMRRTCAGGLANGVVRVGV